MECVLKYGLWGIFGFCFMGATLLPLPTELAVYQGMALGFSPIWVWIAASVGNGLGVCTNYVLGYWGEHWISDKQRQSRFWKKAESWMLKYGKWALLLSWLPYIGDPMCIIAGLFRMPFYQFIAFTWGTRSLRFALLIWFFESII